MVDLKERFRALDQVQTPDLENVIQVRARHLSSVPGALRPADADELGASRLRFDGMQLLAAAAILVLAIGLAVLVQFARSGLPSRQTPSPTPSAAPGSGEAGIRPTIHMTSASVGWAAILGQPGQIIRTSDGGIRWVDVTPHNLSAKWGAQAVFVDDSHAWLLTLPAETVSGTGVNRVVTDWGPVEIWRTQDGGHTWQRLSSFPLVPWFTGQKDATLSFVDRLHGWLYVPFSGQGGRGTAVYRTTDGGAHWAEVSVSDGFPGHTTRDNAIPPDCYGDMSFTGAQDGWLYAGCSTLDRFFSTRDGGVTWKELEVPQKICCFPNDWHYRGPIARSGGSSLLFTVIGLGTGEFATYELSTSEDGGSTWIERPLPAGAFALGKPGSISLRPSFVGNTGWIVIDGQLYVTRDSGRSWQKVGRAINGWGNAWNLDLVDTSTAWVLAGGVDGAKTVVLKSSDGGRSWTQTWISQ